MDFVCLILNIFVVLGFGCHPTSISDIYSQFHSIGITIELDNYACNTSIELYYKIAISDSFIRGHDFVMSSQYEHPDHPYLMSSIFNAEQDTEYHIKVKLFNPDNELTATQKTRSENEFDIIYDNIIYVKSDGIYENDCSSLQTACNIQKALNESITENEWDQILLSGGTYYYGNIWDYINDFKEKNINSDKIVFMANPSESDESNPVIFYGGFETKRWQWIANEVNGNIFETNVVGLQYPKTVIADGQRLLLHRCLFFGDMSSCDDMTIFASLDIANVSGYYYNTTTEMIYVRFVNDAIFTENVDPNLIDIEISKYHSAFDTNYHDDIEFIGLQFELYGDWEQAKGIDVNNSTNILIKNCIFNHNNIGIEIKRTTNKLTIENNKFYDTRCHFNWDAIKVWGDDRSLYLEMGAIHKKTYYDTTDGRGTVIRDNYFECFFDGINVGWNYYQYWPLNKTDEMDIYNNHFQFMADDAIEMDGWCSNCRIWNNVINDVLVAFSFAPSQCGPIFIFRNLVYSIGFGTSFTKTNSGYMIKTESSSSKYSGPLFFYHNTLDASTGKYNNNTVGAQFTDYGKWIMTVLLNNIFLGSWMAIYNKELIYPVSFDYDCLFSLDEYYLNECYWDGSKITFQNLQNTYFVETNGVWYYPHFVDKSNGDYRLTNYSNNSIIIDTAKIIYGINNVNFYQNGPDRGAFEFNPNIINDETTNQPTTYQPTSYQPTSYQPTSYQPTSSPTDNGDQTDDAKLCTMNETQNIIIFAIIVMICY